MKIDIVTDLSGCNRKKLHFAIDYDADETQYELKLLALNVGDGVHVLGKRLGIGIPQIIRRREI